MSEQPTTRNTYYATMYTYCDECEEEVDQEFEIITFIRNTFSTSQIRNLINDLIKYHYKDYLSDPSIFINSIYSTLRQLREDKKISLKFL